MPADSRGGGKKERGKQDPSPGNVSTVLSILVRPHPRRKDVLEALREALLEQGGAAPKAAALLRGFLAAGGLFVLWAANNRLEISNFNFKFPGARSLEVIGFVLGCIKANFCK